jgi:membrane dipeptidase
MRHSLGRRDFLRVGISSAAGILSAGSLGSLLGCGSSCPDTIVRTFPQPERRVLADLHVHPMMEDWINRTPVAVRDSRIGKLAQDAFNSTHVSWKTCHQARIDLLCVGHFNVLDEWLSMPTDPNPDASRTALRMMDILEEELQRPEVKQYASLARNANELSALLAKKGTPDYRVAVVHALEGGHALGGTEETVEQFARRGVALITITHHFTKGIASSPNPLPFFPDAGGKHPHLGLSDLGKRVIKEMVHHGIIIDVTHTTSTALADIFKEWSGTLLATHQSARTLGEHPYSFYDEHIQEIAHRKGVIGVIIDPYFLSNYDGDESAKKHGSLDDVVRTIRYIYKICGTHKSIGIGSDFSGYIIAPNDMDCLGQIDRLREKLLTEFDGNQDIVEDIMANNTINFLQTNWKSGT